MSMGYDDDDPRAAMLRENLRDKIYAAPQPETQRNRVRALARRIRGKP